MDKINKYTRKINGKITKEYAAWKSMKSRCNPNSTYERNKNYRLNGIKVCDRWKNSYENFIDDVGLAPGVEYSLDRIDNLKNYCPENCRWSTQKEQVKNRGSFNRLITYKGETKVLKDWARDLGLEYSGLRKRIVDKGMSFKDAIDENKIYKRVFYKQEWKTMKEWSKVLNIPVTTLYSRRNRGWSVEKMFETPVNTKI